jgi:lysophospholipase L1-like esterase
VRALPRLLLAIACALAPVIGVAFGSPPGYALLGIAVALAVARTSGAGSAISLVAACGVALALYAGVLRVSGLDERIYYRFQERFSTWNPMLGHRAYCPGISYRAIEPHGDLQLFTREPIAESRDVAFRSDSEGFRNDADYADQPWVLVGDSFVSGVGMSQEDLLQARLAPRGIRAYNLAHPGDLLDYEVYWRSFVARHGHRSRLVVFLFEGNDFPGEGAGRLRAPWRVTLDERVRDLTAPLTRLATYRVTRTLVASLAKRGERDGSDAQVVSLAGARVAFYVPYMQQARALEIQGMAPMDAAFARLAPDLAAVFFIPTKYRVYQPWVVPDEQLPRASWQHLARLCEEFRVSCTDLTPALIRRSEALLAEHRFTWWRDDTHWNGAGVDAAAEVVASVLHDIGRAS